MIDVRFRGVNVLAAAIALLSCSRSNRTGTGSETSAPSASTAPPNAAQVLGSSEPAASLKPRVPSTLFEFLSNALADPDRYIATRAPRGGAPDGGWDASFSYEWESVEGCTLRGESVVRRGMASVSIDVEPATCLEKLGALQSLTVQEQNGVKDQWYRPAAKELASFYVLRTTAPGRADLDDFEVMTAAYVCHDLGGTSPALLALLHADHCP